MVAFLWILSFFFLLFLFSLFSCGYATLWEALSVRRSVGRSVMVIELESVKMRISAPAHPSATGIGHVSGLVYNYVNITYTRYLLMVVYICLSSHYGCWHFNLFCAASCTACVIFWWILIVAPGFQVFHESLILSLQRLMNRPWLDWRFRHSGKPRKEGLK